MSCWPMKNLGSRSPRYSRNRCSAGESIKWNQSRRSMRTDDDNTCDWNVWFKRNKKIITKLSMLASEPINEMGALLYSLTLQNYNSILYPKSSGWNSQNVPFSCLDACDNYLHIFNLDGNLRDPRHPRSLVLLLEYIKSVLNDDVDLSARFPLDTILNTDHTSSVRSAVKYHELYPYFQKKTYFIYSRRLGRLLDPDTDKQQIADEIRSKKQSLEQGQKTWRPQAEEHRRTRTQRSYDVQRRSPSEINHHQYTLNATNRIDGTSLPSGSMRTLYPSNHTLVDEKGRRFGHGSRQLIDLRTKRAEIMRLLISKMHKGDPDRVLKGLKAFELKETSHGKRRKTKFATEHLDSFYTDTVTTESKKKTPFYVSRDADATQSAAPIKDAARIQPMYKEKDREPDGVRHKERRYFADPLPVLFHAPYNEKMESTWLRRDPHQLRLQEDGHVAASGARRYKRQSVQQSIARAQKNYSIHSLNSMSSHELDASKPDVLKKKPEYRRVFSSQSRKFKKKSS